MHNLGERVTCRAVGLDVGFSGGFLECVTVCAVESFEPLEQEKGEERVKKPQSSLGRWSCEAGEKVKSRRIAAELHCRSYFEPFAVP